MAQIVQYDKKSLSMTRQISMAKFSFALCFVFVVKFALNLYFATLARFAFDGRFFTSCLKFTQILPF